MSLLEARALAHTYPGPVRALGGVDLGLDAGEVLVVLGPNGSGKSTLLRCLAGLLAPTEGAVRLRGRPLDEHRPRERARQLAVVPQFLPELPDVRVDHFVLGGRYAHLRRFRGAGRVDLDAVGAALEAADAAAWGGRLLSELSGGQRQRVLIARALAQEAAALLIDEPTSGLDPEHQLRVFELIARLTRDGRAALVVTHDLNLASQFATRIVLLDRGRVAAQGPVASILRREILEPVYGPDLHYGRLRGRDGREHVFVLPWLGREA